MGSRRIRRALGRTASTTRPLKKLKVVIGKAQKQANRAQQKASRLAAARTARQAVQSLAPYLIGVLPVNDVTDLQIDASVSALQSVPLEKGMHAFETAIVRRNDRTRREVLLTALDVAKVADIIIVLFNGRDDMDDEAIEIIDAIRAQGLPSVYTISIGDGSGDPELRKLRARQLVAESLGEEHALRPIEVDTNGGSNAAEINRLALRRIVTKSPHQVSWRGRYGYMLVESATAGVSPMYNSTCVLTICGWVRGRGLSANELVHITGFGSFAALQITDVDTGEVLSVRQDDQAEPVESEAEVDEIMGEQTWPPDVDDGDSADNDDVGEAFAKEFDAAIDGENAENDDEDDERIKGNIDDAVTENGDDMDLEADDDLPVNADDVRNARDAAKSDMEFPDEVDTPLDQPARIRFARYRGLKSLRTGEWDPKEQLPREYASLFQFRNLGATRKRVLAASAKEVNSANNERANFARHGKKVFICLKDVPQRVQEQVMKLTQTKRLPVVACGLLRHENRRSVVHFAVRRVDSLPENEIVKAKSRLEMHSGFIRFTGRPMFSENNANSDKHKMERYLCPGRPTVVSFYGPAVYAPAPALLCYVDGSVIASGSAMGADPDRIILKRIILTGYPFKTQKKRAVVKFMFFNPEDIRWFKPVELWTKLGRSGHILEPLGTHGHMKCLFDNVILHHDTVCMTLYKRVYPKLVDKEPVTL